MRIGAVLNRFASRLDYAFWTMPVAIHYSWAFVAFILESVTGSPNPRTFENVAKLRRERIGAHSSRNKHR